MLLLISAINIFSKAHGRSCYHMRTFAIKTALTKAFPGVSNEGSPILVISCCVKNNEIKAKNLLPVHPKKRKKRKKKKRKTTKLFALRSNAKICGWNDEVVKYLLNSLNSYKSNMRFQDLHKKVFSAIPERLLPIKSHDLLSKVQTMKSHDLLSKVHKEEYTLSYISNTFIARLKLAKNQANPKQHLKAKLSLFTFFIHVIIQI